MRKVIGNGLCAAAPVVALGASVLATGLGFGPLGEAGYLPAPFRQVLSWGVFLAAWAVTFRAGLDRAK